MTITEKVDNLLTLRSKIEQAKEELDKKIKPLQIERDELQENIVKAMARQGFNSVRADTATITRVVRRSLVINDEDALVADLKERGLKDMYKEKVNPDLWRPFATESIKQETKLAGTEMKETEFISVRRNQNDKKQKDN